MYVFFSIFILMMILDVKELMDTKKELFVYLGLSILTIILAVFYYSDIFRESFISIILKAFNIEY